MIEEYHFGSITINGETYDYDVEVRWLPPVVGEVEEVLKWQREESHRVDIESVKKAIGEKPALIIIGTGESGAARVLEETKEEILSKGIGLIIEKTEKAIQTFNEEKEKNRKIIALFHLTC